MFQRERNPEKSADSYFLHFGTVYNINEKSSFKDINAMNYMLTRVFSSFP